LALFGRRPAERVLRSVLPASENLQRTNPLRGSALRAKGGASGNDGVSN
jgi:hypothetical protein